MFERLAYRFNKETKEEFFKEKRYSELFKYFRTSLRDKFSKKLDSEVYYEIIDKLANYHEELVKMM